MRVLHIFKTYIPENFTGIPRVIETVAEGTARYGVRTSVLTLSPRPATEQPVQVGQHAVYQVPLTLELRSSRFSLGAFSLFRKLNAEADILHYHFPSPMGDLLHLVGGAGKPALVTYHCDIVKQKFLRHLYAPIMHRFLDKLDAIVATSPNYAASSPVLQRYAEKTHVIPIGITPDAVADPARVAHWREKLGKNFFLFVGSHRYYKGLPFLIAAARRVPYKIALIGEVNEAEIEGCPENVTVIGKVNDVDKTAILELSRGLILPSHLRAEAFGIVLLEAMRASRPIVSCEIGSGMSYVNLHEQTGLILPPRDPDALAAAMTRLSEHPVEAAQFGTTGRARFEAEFQASMMAQRYHALYSRLLRASALSFGI